jgi:hypothetical protein
MGVDELPLRRLLWRLGMLRTGSEKARLRSSTLIQANEENMRGRSAARDHLTGLSAVTHVTGPVKLLYGNL